MFQRAIEGHPDIVRVVGDTICCVRFLVLVTDEGPIIESAILTIPRAEHDADNFWRDGNMLGTVDADRGTIGTVTTGIGEKAALVEEHPDTGVRLPGYALPRWVETVDLCLSAAATLPGVRTQSWDIAFSSAGPVLLEVNFGGDLILHQIAHRRGVLSERYVEHLRRNGYKGRLPG